MKIYTSIKGKLSLTPADPPRPAGRYVFQRVRAGLGNITSEPARNMQLRAHVIPIDPKTPAQLSRRSLFAQAVLAWQSATPEQKAEAATAGVDARLPAYQWFVGDYIRHANPASGTTWDGGATTWDGGATTWDI